MTIKHTRVNTFPTFNPLDVLQLRDARPVQVYKVLHFLVVLKVQILKDSCLIRRMVDCWSDFFCDLSLVW